MIGQVLNDRYEITERLGGGGMAVVLKATDKYLGRTVSIKVLRDQFASDGDFLHRFRREAQAVASLSHPHIVSIYDFGQHGDIHYLVMEYVEGESLQRKIATEGPLAPESAVDIALQILDALEHAHQRRVIHRDIKPHNILITPSGRVKVTDFGVARAIGGGSTLVHTGNIVGSAHYFSPEQAKGEPVDARSDLYALGVVLFEMLTGRVPFQGDNPLSVALKHVQEDPPSVRAFNPAVPAALDRIVARALAKEPARRYQSVPQFRAALESWRRGRPLPVSARAGNAEAATAAQAGGPVDDDTLVFRDNGHWEEVLEGEGDEDEGAYRKGRARTVVMAALVGLALIGYAGYIFIRWFQVPTIQVPDVRGKPLRTAQDLLEKQDLNWEIVAERADPQVPAYYVIEQDPVPNQEARPGRKIGLTVSTGPDLVLVPGVVGRHKFEAETVLENADFAVDEEPKYDESVPEGYVIAQNPPEGDRVERGRKVFLQVSLGPPPPPFGMPNVVGSTRDDALRTLGENGLRPGRVTQVPAGFPSGVVASQNPPPQTLVRVGEAIDLVVSTGCAARTTRAIPVEGNGLVAVRAVVVDQAGQRVVYEQTQQSGRVVNLNVCWDGTSANLLVYFNGELRHQEGLTPR